MNVIKKIPTASVVTAVLGIFLILWGIFQSSLAARTSVLGEALPVDRGMLSAENDGGYILTTAPLSITKQPRDPLTGVTADGVVLIRTVEMYQYVIENDEVYMQFSDKQEKDIRGRNGETYKNPVFPEDIRNAVFLADVKAGELSLSSDYVATFAEDYENFENEHDFYRPDDYPEFQNDHGLVPVKDGYYDNGTPDERKIGDIRISYEYLPADSFDEITFFGMQLIGKLMTDGNKTGLMIDKAVDKSFIETDLSAEYSSAASGLYLFGGLLLGVSVLLTAISIRKNGKKEEI